jgi:RimJ/RimL family protein N-acetyltransferase
VGVIDYTRRREEIPPLLPAMFTIISQNMREIAPTGNTLEEDRAAWTQAMLEELRNPGKRWIFAFCGKELAGYTLYRIAGDTLHMDEIQVAKGFQGDGRAFPALMGKLLEDARAAGVERLRSYANRQNLKSQATLRKLGLQVIGETPRGFRYQGRAGDAQAWFQGKHNQLR